MSQEQEAGRAISRPPTNIERSQLAQLLVPTLLFAILTLVLAGPHYLVQDSEYRSEIFLHLLAIQDVPGALLMIAIGLVAWLGSSRLSHRSLTRCLIPVARRPHLILLASFTILLAATQLIYQHHPLSLDEYAPSYQAAAFAEGEIFGFVPPALAPRLVPPWFINRFWLYSPSTGRLASAYWPGHALLMAPFSKIGLPWLLNPLLALGFLVLLWKLTHKLFRHPLAPTFAVLLCLASPEFLINAVSFYSMTPHLFLNLIFVYLLLEPTRYRLFGAGLVGSLALTLHNPVPHFLVALPWILWLLSRKDRFRLLTPMALGYLPLTLLLGAGWLYLRATFSAEWSAVAGQAAVAVPPVAEETAEGWALFLSLMTKFSVELFRLPDPSAIANRLAGWAKLVLWAAPALPFAAIVGHRFINQIGTLTRNPEQHIPYLRLVGWSALSTLIGYFFIVISQGHGWGFRYFHQAWWALPLLGTAAMVGFYSKRSPAFRFMAIAIVSGLLFNNGLRAWQVESFIDRHLQQRPAIEETFTGIVFLDTRSGYYRQDLVQNDPFLRNPIFYLVAQGFERDQAFLNKWQLEGDCVSTDGYNSAWKIKSEDLDTLRRGIPPQATGTGRATTENESVPHGGS